MVTTKEKYKLRRFISMLEQIRGRHTELVSVYIPSGYDINKIINHLIQEQSTAANIKDKTTQKHVIDALEKMIRHLRLFKQTPPNGLAVFSGNISEKEGKANIKVFSIEPPEPLNVRIYRCDQTFKLDILKQMLEHRETYGLVILDAKEATIGLLKGTSITVLKHMTSGVPSKIRAGGQSAMRYARLREGALKEFFKRIAEVVKKEFLDMKNLKGILVGGPGPTKEDFLNGKYLHTELQNKVVCVQDLSYTGEFGLEELVEKSKGILAKEAIMEEKEIMQKFLSLLAKSPNKVSYGIDDVKKFLEMGVVETLLISEELDEKIALDLEEIAEKFGTSVHYISTDTKEGQQLKDLGKVGAILRYEIYT